MSEVFFTKDVSPEGLTRVFTALGVKLKGKVGVKVSTGEAGAKNFLSADLIAPFVKSLNGTILECNTAYPGSRNNVQDHLKTARAHGFTFSEVDIMDADGDFEIPVASGKHLKNNLIGSHLKNYDSIVNLAHCKGHPMGGFGGNLKNQSIGIASRSGKARIHSCGHTDSPDACWSDKHDQIDFIESMAEAATSVADYLASLNKQIIYINVMNKISTLCDCASNQDDPVMSDLGISASLDPVANDQCFIDLVWASPEPGAEKLRKWIDKRLGREILPYAESLGLGSTSYKLVNLD